VTATATSPGTPVLSRRRWPLWAAGALTLVITLLHALLGTPNDLDPLLASDLDEQVRQVFQVQWHVTTAVLGTLPVALFWAAHAERTLARPVLVYAWTIAAAFALSFFAVNLFSFGPAGLFTLPQWAMFAPVLVLIPLAR
jgi:hypothetical protein